MKRAIYNGFTVTVYSVQSVEDGLWTADIRLSSNSFDNYSVVAGTRFKTREEAEEHGLGVAIERVRRKTAATTP